MPVCDSQAFSGLRMLPFTIELVLPTQPFDDCEKYQARFLGASVPTQNQLIIDRWTISYSIRIERTCQALGVVNPFYGFAGPQSVELPDYFDDAVNTRLFDAIGALA